MAAHFTNSFGEEWAERRARRDRLESERRARRVAKYAAPRQRGTQRSNDAASPLAPPTPSAPPEPLPKRRKVVGPPVLAQSETRCMTVSLPAPPKLRPRTLEHRLAALCAADMKQPYNLRSVWSDRRVNVVVVQMPSTYGAETALFKWLAELAPGRTPQAFDLSATKVHLNGFLQNVWVARAGGKGVVPVLTATADALAWLGEIVSGLPPREEARSYQRVVLVTANAYDEDNEGMRALRRMRDRVRVVKVGGPSEGCLRRCLGEVVAELNRASEAHNATAPAGRKRAVLRLTEPQQRMIVAQSAGDPAFFVNALGYRVLTEGRMDLRALAADGTGMTDFQAGSRLLLGSPWSHLVTVELPDRHLGELEAAVRKQRGAAMQVCSRLTARRSEPWARVQLMAPQLGRPAVMALLPAGATAWTEPAVGPEHLTPTVQTFVEVNAHHAMAARAKRGRGSKADRELAMLDAMAEVADDLTLCDEMDARYSHRELLRYSSAVRAATLPANGARAFGDEGVPASQPVPERELASRFYEHLDGVRKRGERRRRIAELGRRWAVPARGFGGLGQLARVRGFWGQHVPVVPSQVDRFARDAARYAAVALHKRPAEPGELTALAGWAEAKARPPASLGARHVAEWFSQRCSYPHFTATVAWALAWSALAEGLRDGCRPQQLLDAAGSMLREGVRMAGVVRGGVVGERLPPTWLEGRFPPKLGGGVDQPPQPVVDAAMEVWRLAQSVVPL